MMSRVDRLSRLSSAVSIAIGVGLAEEFTNWIEKYNLPAWFPHVSAVVIVVVIFQLLKFIFDSIFEMSEGMRKILLGREFVEGTWLDLMSQNGIPVAYGITRMASSGTSLRISGEDYDLNAKRTGYYSVDMLIFEFPKIRYKYTYQRSDNQGLEEAGFGEFQFRERNGPPVKCSGFFFNLMEDRRITFESWKVIDKEILAMLDSPESDKKAILGFFKLKLESSSH